MTTKVLNISPDLPYDWENIDKKCTTFRTYPIPEGTIVASWIKKRGMRKGWYCLTCNKFTESIGEERDYLEETEYEMGQFCSCNDEAQEIPHRWMPKPLPRGKVVSCEEVEMHMASDGALNVLGKGKSVAFRVPPEELLLVKCLHEVPRDEGFSSNKDWIDAMMKMHGKELIKGWVKFYWIRWVRI